MRLATFAALTAALSLALAKAIAWWLSGSVSLLAGLTDSLLDGAASLLNLLAVHYALRPADEDHRYGHGKAEALAGLGQALFIGASALLVGSHAIDRLQHPEPLGAQALGIAVILLSLVAACIALPVLLRGIPKSPDDAMRKEVREAWRRTAEAAIHALEAEEVVEADGQQDAAQAALAAELKARIMSEYRHQLEVYNDSAEAQALASQMDQLESRLRLKALRAQRLELYSLRRHHEIGDDALSEILKDLDLSEANLGTVK